MTKKKRIEASRIDRADMGRSGLRPYTETVNGSVGGGERKNRTLPKPGGYGTQMPSWRW
jgi:hypothetical protein